MTETSFARLIQAHFSAASQDRKIDGSEMARAISLVKDAAGTDQAAEAQAALSQGLAQYRDRMDSGTAGLAESFLARPRTLPRVDALVKDELASAIDRRSGGGLSAQDLEAAEAEVRAKNPGYEADVSQAMLAMIFTRGDELTVDGAKWYQDKYGAMDGHAARYQQILNEHQKGSVLVDSNSNGELDAMDRVVGENGSVEIGQEAADDLKIRGAIVGAAHDMKQAKHNFVGLEEAYFSEKYFEPEGRVGTFKLKEGVSPSEAVQDMFTSPDKYGFECATASVVTYYKAMLDVLGPEAFDRTCKDLVIGPWKMEGDLNGAMQTFGSGETPAREGFRETLRPGDYTYFNNWQVSDEAAALGFRGENVFYLGDGKYYGHGLGILTEEKVVESLNRGRIDGATQPASLAGFKRQLDAELLRARTR